MRANTNMGRMIQIKLPKIKNRLRADASQLAYIYLITSLRESGVYKSTGTSFPKTNGDLVKKSFYIAKTLCMKEKDIAEKWIPTTNMKFSVRHSGLFVEIPVYGALSSSEPIMKFFSNREAYSIPFGKNGSDRMQVNDFWRRVANGEKDSLVGSPFSGREHADTINMALIKATRDMHVEVSIGYSVTLTMDHMLHSRNGDCVEAREITDIESIITKTPKAINAFLHNLHSMAVRYQSMIDRTAEDRNTNLSFSLRGFQNIWTNINNHYFQESNVPRCRNEFSRNLLSLFLNIKMTVNAIISNIPEDNGIKYLEELNAVNVEMTADHLAFMMWYSAIFGNVYSNEQRSADTAAAREWKCIREYYPSVSMSLVAIWDHLDAFAKKWDRPIPVCLAVTRIDEPVPVQETATEMVRRVTEAINEEGTTVPLRPAPQRNASIIGELTPDTDPVAMAIRAAIESFHAADHAADYGEPEFDEDWDEDDETET